MNMRIPLVQARHLFATLFACLLPVAAMADGPFGIDHKVAKDDRGIYKQSVQNAALGLVLATEVGVALMEGNKSEAGKGAWAALDSVAVTAVAAEGLKLAFRRVRPKDSNDPNQFFKSRQNDSFPSGQTALMTAAVTPLIARYSESYPAVWGLALLPLYAGVARVKVNDHWQSDVLAGALLGGVIGYNLSERRESLMLGLLPGGFSVGLRRQF